MSDAVVTSTVASSPSPARRIPGRELLTEAQIAEVRERSPWRGIGMIAHAWAVILGAMALAFVWICRRGPASGVAATWAAASSEPCKEIPCVITTSTVRPASTSITGNTFSARLM